MPNPFPAEPTPPALATWANTEYTLSLPRHWTPVPTGHDRSVSFESAVDAAGLMVSVDFYVIPPDKARATAERVLNARLATHAKQTPGAVDVFDSGARSRPDGGLEMHLAAQLAGGDVVMEAVYVMSRRVLNLTLVSRRGRDEATRLLHAVRAHFRPAAA